MDAVADAPAAEVMPWDVGVETSASLPMASAERGGRTSDTTHGVASLALEGTYRVSRAIGLGATVRYGGSVPTLCGSFDECMASVGTDNQLLVRARVFLPMIGRAEPYVDLGAGWEWFTSKLKDGNVRSSRAYDGPIFLSTEAALPFPLGRHATLGPALGVTIGTFTHRRLETPSFSQAGAVEEHAIHAWPTLSARLSVRF